MRLPLALAALIIATPAIAARRCQAIILQTTGSQEAPDITMKKGELFGPVTLLKVNRKIGGILYCAHGTNCYPSSVIDVIGPCHFVPDTFDDPDYFTYEAH